VGTPYLPLVTGTVHVRVLSPSGTRAAMSDCLKGRSPARLPGTTSVCTPEADSAFVKRR
jgi:hypothetical protein